MPTNIILAVRTARYFALLLAVTLLVFSEANARGQYLAQWSNTYPETSSDDVSCQLCHQLDSGGNGWNRYGCAIRPEFLANQASNGGDDFAALADALDTVEDLVNPDASPGAGNEYTFLDEIRYNTQPGWVAGAMNTINFRPDCGPETMGNAPLINQIPPDLTMPPLDTAVTEIDLDISGAVPNPAPGPLLPTPIMIQMHGVADDFSEPVKAVTASGINGSIFVVEQRGKIFRVDLTTGEKTLFHDVSTQLVPARAGFDERGLLGLAFHPDYANNGLFYTFQSEPSRAEQDGDVDFTTLPNNVAADHRAMIVEYRASDASCNSSIKKQKTLLIIDEPQFNHNGGDLDFGPDGFLYASLGDGGGADDQGNGSNPDPGFDGHGLLGNGRDEDTILGTIIRIDPTGNNSANGNYGIPGDNPFPGVADGVDEIYAYGFRNPYRFSFDKMCFEQGETCVTLTAADVGQNELEEIDDVTSGDNFGWNYKEGTLFFVDMDGSAAIVTTDAPPGVPVDLVEPIAEYGRDTGISVTGGYIYRGDNVSGLEGQYVFADFARTGSTRKLMTINLNIGLVQVNEFDTDVTDFVTGFGQDVEGELYIVTKGGFGNDTPADLFGTLQKILPLGGVYTPPDSTGEMAMCPPTEDLCTAVRTSSGKVVTFCL